MSAAIFAHPIAFEALVADWARDLASDEEDALELHVMGCAECTASSERVAAIAVSVRALIPPLITGPQVAALRARGLRIEENPMVPGERKAVVFRREVDVLLHRLGGLDLANAAEVSVTVRDEDTGDVIYEEPRAPFDAENGEVLVACQRHFAAYPPNVLFEVRAVGPGAEPRVARYMIPHTFESHQMPTVRMPPGS